MLQNYNNKSWVKIQLHITLKIYTYLIKIETRILRKISQFGELEMCIVIKPSQWTTGTLPTCQSMKHVRGGFDSWVGKILWRRAWQHTPIFFPGNPMDRGAWWATIHGVAKSWTCLRQLSMCAVTKLKLCVCACVHAHERV